MSLLDLVPFFNDFSRSFKIRLLYNMEILDAFKNQSIYNEGGPCADLYFVIRGELEISKQISIISDGGKQKLKSSSLTDVHSPNQYQHFQNGRFEENLFINTKVPVYDSNAEKIKDINDGVWSLQKFKDNQNLLNNQTHSINKGSSDNTKTIVLDKKQFNSICKDNNANKRVDYNLFSETKLLKNKSLISQLKTIDLSKLPIPIEPKLESNTHKRFYDEDVMNKELIRKRKVVEFMKTQQAKANKLKPKSVISARSSK